MATTKNGSSAKITNSQANRKPLGPEDIALRAYQIYLERGAHAGQELDDWLRAERELQKVALFTRGWNRLEQRRERGSEGGN